MNFHKPLSPLRVGIDIDDTLGDFVTPYVEKLYQLRGDQPSIPFTRDQALEWKVEKQLGFDRDIVEQFWSYANSVEGQSFWLSRPALAQRTVLNPLFQIGADVYFVTKCPFTLRKVQSSWVSNHYDVCNPQIIMADEKGPICRGMALHALIDDKPENLISVLRECGTKCLPILIDAPFNRKENHLYITRAYGIQHAVSILLDKYGKAMG